MDKKIPFFDFGGSGEFMHFAHPNGFPPATFGRFIEPLKADYHVIGMCQRPLWENSQPEELENWHQLAGDLIRFFDQQGLENVVGVGLSSGSVATMYAALERPSLFRALILIEPVFLPPQIIEMVKADPQVIEELPLVVNTRRRRNRWSSRQAAFDHFRARSAFGRWPDDTLWDYVNHGLYQAGNGEMTLRYRREWEAHVYTHFARDVWEHIPNILHPTLAIRGVESDTIFPEAWQLWQEKQPGATFIEIEDAGHMVPMEQPVVLTSHILKFLNSL